MDFDDLVTELAPPPKRIGKHDGAGEQHLYEGAVMVAYAMHLLRTEDTAHVWIHPDGTHGKQFDFRGWLAKRGFAMISSTGKTTYGGTYADGQGRTVTIKLPAKVMWLQK